MVTHCQKMWNHNDVTKFIMIKVLELTFQKNFDVRDDINRSKSSPK